MATAKERIILELQAQGSKQTAQELSATADRIQELQDETRRLNSELNKLVPTQGRHNKQTRNSNGNYKEAAGGMRMMRGGAAQLGYQIQDVAVQLQMGQNAMMVFAQQGSQVASWFGAGGAMFGALLAVGAGLATYFKNADKAANATKELKERINELGVEYKDLTAAQKEFLITSQRAAIASEQQTQKALQEEMDQLKVAVDLYDKLTASTDPYVRAQASASIAWLDSAYNISEAKERLVELQATLDTSEQAVISHKQEIDALNGSYMATEEGVKAYYDALLSGDDKQRERAEQRRKAQQDEFGVFLDNFASEIAAIDARTAAEKKAAEEKIATEQMLYDTFKGFDEKKAEDEKAALDRFFDNFAEETRMMEERNARIKQLNDAAMQSYGDMFGGIGKMMKEGSNAQKAAFAVQKGIATAQAIMNLHQAISQANAEKVPFPAKLAMIAQAIATGTAAIAGVKGASFEGGGYTGMGPRAGGVDGKGGFPAILHPNETVIDHTQGGGTPVNISFTINAVDTKGFDELLATRRGQIMSMVNQAVNNRGRPSLG